MPSIPPILQSLLLLLAPFALLLAEGRSLKKIPSLLGLENKKIIWQIFEGMKLFAFTLALLFLESALFAKFGLEDSGKVVEVLQKQTGITLFAIVAIAPVGEELLFRGYLQKKIGIILSSVLFAGLHSGFGSLVEITAALTASLLFGAFVKRNSVVLPAIIAHALINVYSISAVFLTT